MSHAGAGQTGREQGEAKLGFTLFDAHPIWMRRFIQTLEFHGGAPIDLRITIEGDGIHLNAKAELPESKAIGYFVASSADVSAYLRCIILFRPDEISQVEEALGFHLSVSRQIIGNRARKDAAEIVPGLMQARGLRTDAPIVFEGDPNCAGLVALREMVIHHHEEDLTQPNSPAVTIFRIHDAIVYTAALEAGSLDPYVIMIVYCGSEKSGRRFKSIYQEGEANGPQPPDRRREAIKRYFIENVFFRVNTGTTRH